MRHLVMTDTGNDFLNMILDWDKTQKVMKEEDDRFVKAKMLVDGHDFIFFFICRHNVYGANENARGVFSVMKHPMDEPGYDEMSFSATNLSSAMKGEPKEEIFIYKDIDNIKVINKDVARHLLMKHHHKHKDHAKVQEKMRDIESHRRDKDQRSKDGRIKLNKDFEKIESNLRSSLKGSGAFDDPSTALIARDVVQDGGYQPRDMITYVSKVYSQLSLMFDELSPIWDHYNEDDGRFLFELSSASRYFADAKNTFENLSRSYNLSRKEADKNHNFVRRMRLSLDAIKTLDEWVKSLTQRFPNTETLLKLYPDLNNVAGLIVKWSAKWSKYLKRINIDQLIQDSEYGYNRE